MELDLKNQNGLLLKNLLDFYKEKDNLKKLLDVVNGNSKISLRLIDWMVCNFSKKYFIIYSIPFSGPTSGGTPKMETSSATSSAEETILQNQRFQVYLEYKLNLKAFSKKRFDPFCRWDRITIPIPQTDCPATQQYFETTIGQLNFFKWAISNYILDYIEQNYEAIECDMNTRNTVSKKKHPKNAAGGGATEGGSANGAGAATTRKKREQLSVSAAQSLKKENINITIRF